MAESETSFKNKKKYFLMCSDGFGDSLEFIIFGIPLGFYISIYIYECSVRYMTVITVTLAQKIEALFKFY